VAPSTGTAAGFIYAPQSFSYLSESLDRNGTANSIEIVTLVTSISSDHTEKQRHLLLDNLPRSMRQQVEQGPHKWFLAENLPLPGCPLVRPFLLPDGQATHRPLYLIPIVSSSEPLFTAGRYPASGPTDSGTG
jgi:hypothetical protein